MLKQLAAAAVVLTASLLSTPSQAALIFRDFETLNGGINIPDMVLARIELNIVNEGGTQTNLGTFDYDPVLRSLSFDSSDGSVFDIFAAFLTDNSPSRINPVFQYDGGPSGGGGLGSVINDAVAGVDLVGHDIESIVLTVVDEDYLPNEDATFSLARVLWSLEVFGTGDPVFIAERPAFEPIPPESLPEPSPIALIGLGLLGALALRRLPRH